MIRSMTGYGRAEAPGARVTLAVECKSTNHRHLDIALKFPRALGPLEPDARRMVQAALTRGRVEVSVAFSAAEGGALTPLAVNLGQAREYAEVARRLGGELGLGGELRLEWIMAQPGVISREEQAALAPEETWPLLAEALGRALADLVARREAEGEALGRELEALLDGLVAHVEGIAERAPEALRRRTERLRERILSLRGEVPRDEARLATEVAVLADKTDVSEELARLRAHLGQFARLLREGGPIGRTLDFLLQEMHREVNTVGAKADDLEIAQAVIAAKSALEKLREQVQNIE